ncbi:MAG: FAD-dependent oxidoreductase [Spirochaetaceae bacterium]|nr:MAG: FAD-dependent oxidoreductase [Spirochaetaceae bacterium]
MAVVTPHLPNLFRPLMLKEQLLKNRIVFAPVSTRLAGTDGSISPQMLAHYANMASGGAAALVTETFHVDDIASKFTVVQPAIHHDRFLPGLSSLSDRIKNAGALAIAQIGHAGRQTSFQANTCVPVAPSRIPDGPTRDCHVLSKKEIAAIILAFAAAARRALTAGFDGVEIHAGNGYLINEFLSPYTNRRHDEYGKRRELFLLQTIEEIDRTIPSSSIVGLRLGCGDFVEGGLDAEEVLRIAQMLPPNRIDYIHTSAGTSESNDYTIQPIYQPRAILKDVAAAIRRSCDIPVVLTGSVNEPMLAEKLLAEGAADLIGLGRALLADPQLPLKVLRGSLKEVCPCIRCNQGCLGRVREGKTIRCAVNPLLGYEIYIPSLSRQQRSTAGKKVLIAGGGPAGIIAALRAAELGFFVRLFERQKQLGGLLNTARTESFKKDVPLFLDYLLHRITGAKAEVMLEAPMEIDLLAKESPDVFFDATGSQPVMPQIPPGLPYPVLPVRDLLLDLEKYRSSRRAIILGGGSSGCEAALALHAPAIQITVIEQASCILQDLEPVSAISLKRLLADTDIMIQTETRFLRLEPGGVVTDRHSMPLAADLIIVALGASSNTTLCSRLDPHHWHYGINYLPIGDAHLVGKIFEAVHDSYWRVSSLLDKIR